MGHQQTVEQAVSELQKAGVDFGDIRIVEREKEWLQVKDDEVSKLTHTTDVGFSVRALIQGAWGYAGSRTISPENVSAAVAEAVAIAKATRAAIAEPVHLADVEPAQGQYSTPMKTNPFDVPLEDKIAHLFEATRNIRSTGGDKIVAAKGTTVATRKRSWLGNTEGSRIDQDIVISGGGIQAVASDGNEFQRRSYPKDYEGNIVQGGWEHLLALDLPGNAARVADEAVALLSAPPLPAGDATVILDGAQMSIQIHESCGHPIELDRALGEEISLAGASFLTQDRLNNFRYGSDIVNLYADSTTELGPGTFGWDDEGVPAGRWDIVKNGQFVGYLPSRETSARLGLDVKGGAMRAESWSRLPIVRMVNVNLAPGSGSLDDLIADTKDGYLMSVNKSWSIDHLRLNFQFGCEAAWEIKGGKKTRLLKNPVYMDITPRFWGSCDAICGQDDWSMWGWMFCGKGDPVQSMYVGHGCAPARYNGVTVGAGS